MSKIMLDSNSAFHAHLFPNAGGRDTGNQILANEWTLVTSNSGGSISARDILFLQKKQDELLRQLHQEIQQLKTENSELKFQLYAVLKARNPNLKSELKTVSAAVVEGAGVAGPDRMQMISNDGNGGIEVSKNDDPGSSNRSSLAAADQFDAAAAATLHDDANQLESSEHASRNREKKATSHVRRNENATSTLPSASPKRLSTARQYEPENTKLHRISSPNKLKAFAFTGTGTQAKPNPAEKYEASFKEGKSLTSRASIPNTKTSNYGLAQAQTLLVPRSSSASSKRAQTLRQHSLSLLPSNYKDNVATLPPLVFNNQGQRDSNANAEKLIQIKPWSISQAGQKFNPSTMTKQKPTAEKTSRQQHLNSESASSSLQ